MERVEYHFSRFFDCFAIRNSAGHLWDESRIPAFLRRFKHYGEFVVHSSIVDGLLFRACQHDARNNRFHPHGRGRGDVFCSVVIEQTAQIVGRWVNAPV